jgi:hypothetical protein
MSFHYVTIVSCRKVFVQENMFLPYSYLSGRVSHYFQVAIHKNVITVTVNPPALAVGS